MCCVNGGRGWREGARERGSEGARERGSEGARERGSEGRMTVIHILIFSPLETISTSLWASLYHNLPVQSVFCNVSCQFVFVMSSRLLSVHLSLGRPLLLFPVTSMSITFLDRLSASLLLTCPYQCNRFCLRNVDIWHTLSSSCIIWFLTWSCLVLPLIHRSILLHAICSRLSF